MACGGVDPHPEFLQGAPWGLGSLDRVQHNLRISGKSLEREVEGCVISVLKARWELCGVGAGTRKSNHKSLLAPLAELPCDARDLKAAKTLIRGAYMYYLRRVLHRLTNSDHVLDAVGDREANARFASGEPQGYDHCRRSR